MIDVRLRSHVPPDELAAKVGNVLTDADYNVLLTRDVLLRKPDGSVLAVYRRDAIPPELREQVWPTFRSLRATVTRNRGKASGTKRTKKEGTSFTESLPVHSAVVGTLETKKPKVGGAYCRLTAWTGRETERFRALWPLLSFVGERMREDAPTRHAAQMERVQATQPDWIIPGTPFSTVTVNNTFETGVHADKGDLDEGISTLAVFRRGDYRGGVLVFPEYRVGIDMQDGDLLLMDAHEWHGNTYLDPRPVYSRNGIRGDLDEDGEPLFERVSVVSYFRTNVETCGTPGEEAERGIAAAEARNARTFGDA